MTMSISPNAAGAIDVRHDEATPFAALLLTCAIGAPALLGVFPVGFALNGIGYGPGVWVAISWQLASLTTWMVLAIAVLRVLRRRTDANVAAGRPVLSAAADGPGIAPLLLGSLVVHAATIALASNVLVLGRGRPPIVTLFLDVLLLYAPLNLMTILGLIAVAIVAAEHRARLAEVTLREFLERELSAAREEVLSALADLNGLPAISPASTTAAPLERLTVTIGNRSLIVAVDDIDLIEAANYYSQLHIGTRRYLLRQSMNSLEERLDPKRFARIHRSTIVNLDRVAEVRPFDRRSYVVTLRDGRRLMMSRRRRRLLDYFDS